jgi:hypothetical protein
MEVTIVDSSSTPLIYPTFDASMTNVLLISDQINSYQTLVDSANQNTFPIVYSTNSSKADLIVLLRQNFNDEIQRMGIAFHSPGPADATGNGALKLFLDNEQLFQNDETVPYSLNVAWMISIIQEFAIKNVDFLACDTLNYTNWVQYYGILHEITHVTVGASNDKTGNIKYGGDWIMESTGQDIELIYFTQSIEYYQYLLIEAVSKYLADGRPPPNLDDTSLGIFLIGEILTSNRTPSDVLPPYTYYDGYTPFIYNTTESITSGINTTTTFGKDIAHAANLKIGDNTYGTFFLEGTVSTVKFGTSPFNSLVGRVNLSFSITEFRLLGINSTNYSSDTISNASLFEGRNVSDSTITDSSITFNQSISVVITIMRNYNFPRQRKYLYAKDSSINGIPVTSIENINTSPNNNANFSAITNFYIPDTVRTISNNAFEKFSGLTNIIIPNSLIELGGSAFNLCTNLTTVYFMHSVQLPYIYNGAYSNASIIAVYLPTVSNYTSSLFTNAGFISSTDIIVPSITTTSFTIPAVTFGIVPPAFSYNINYNYNPISPITNRTYSIPDKYGFSINGGATIQTPNGGTSGSFTISTSSITPPTAIVGKLNKFNFNLAGYNNTTQSYGLKLNTTISYLPIITVNKFSRLNCAFSVSDPYQATGFFTYTYSIYNSNDSAIYNGSLPNNISSATNIIIASSILESGRLYTVKLNRNSSSYSDSTSLSFTTLATPIITLNLATSNNALLSFTDSTSNANLFTYSYNLIANGTTVAQNISVSLNTIFNAPNLTQKTSYTFNLNRIYNGSQVDTTSFSFTTVALPILTNLLATSSNAVISFTDPSPKLITNGNNSSLNYTYNINNGIVPNNTSVALSQSPLMIQGLPSSTSYIFTFNRNINYNGMNLVDATNVPFTTSAALAPTNNIICFKEDSKILTSHGYRPIQDLKPGDLIQTLKHGFVPIHLIGKKPINHQANPIRIKYQLYRCSATNYPELFEDLVITGCHSILVDGFVDQEQLYRTIEVNGDLFLTDEKYRLPACCDHRASVYEMPGTHTIYHLALENEDYFMNYGIYANGLLVETCSQRYLKELANMELIR